MPRLAFPRQSTQWDCLPKAFEAALLAVFGRHRVPLRALRAVYRYSIDLDDGTSAAAIRGLADALAWVPEVSSRRLRGKEASPEGILSEVRAGQAVVLPVWLECRDGRWPHAVAAVGHEGRRVRVADPYYASPCKAVTLRALGSSLHRRLFPAVAVGRSDA